jgi:2-polyprenyl-3-methyl-5-hydroxy-6-metoxy-1,4-benzoquinol methylase
MNERCCRFAKEVLAMEDVRCSSDPVADLPQTPSYDVIMLWHVFEHLPDPWTVAAAMVRALHPGGTLVLAVPNPEALQLAVLGRRWVHLDVPRHTMLVAIDVLTSRMRDLGLERIAWTCTDPGSLGWNRFGWVHSLRRARHPALRLAQHVLARCCEIAALPWERSGGRGSAYTAVFRKPVP